MIAIQPAKGGFDKRWISYCKANFIPFVIVDCYRNDAIAQLKDCDVLMWQFYQSNPHDILFAKQLLYSLQSAGKIVFPNFNTMWHFDDKVGQKYLLEALGAPLAPSYVFYAKKDASAWVEETNFPKVFKLRGGAGSQNVRLVKTKRDAKQLIRRAFGRGFSQYAAWSNLKERIRKFKKGQTSFFEVVKGFIRLGYPTEFSRIRGKERGYIYFQDFIPGNDSDIRVVVIDNKAFAIKRMARENDFRASGSGTILYDKALFNEEIIKLSLDLADKLKSQCVAFDFVYKGETPLLVEISYGFTPEGYDPCPGYWDQDMNWQQGSFNPYGWMIETVSNKIDRSNG